MSNQPGGQAPEGFYPAENGRMRYWDGNGWTDRYADTDTAPQPQAGSTQAGPPLEKKRSWFARHKILTGLGVLLLLFIVIGLANAGSSPKPTVSAGDPKSSSSSAPASSAPAASAPASSAPASSAPASSAPPSSAPAVPSSAPAPPPPAAAAETVSQQNAVKKAASYLDLTPFSRSGLIKQLEFEKFSNADATYGVDKLNADWNEQAAKKAKSYLAVTSFSHASLVAQLQFDGFTTQQAEYGVQKAGL